MLPLLGTTLLVLAACGGGESSEPATDSDAGDGAGETSDETETVEEVALDLPFSSSGFDQTCATQVAFADTNAYDPGVAAAHPMVVLQRSEESGAFAKNFSEQPSGWIVGDDDDFDDNSELVAVELVGCIESVEQLASGVICDLELDDGSIASLEVVEASYEMNIYATQTGALVGTEAMDASGTDCPSFSYVEDGQTQYLNRVDADQITKAIAGYVAPGGLIVDPTEVPSSAFDLDRLCTTQVGFGGLTPVVEGTGPNLVQLIEETDSGAFVNRSFEAPDGWLADSGTALESVELVACSGISSLVDNGFTCGFEADDGTVTTLKLLNGTYDLIVYEATTGAVVSETRLQADSTDCPPIALIDDDQTELLATPDDAVYLAELESVVTPA